MPDALEKIIDIKNKIERNAFQKKLIEIINFHLNTDKVKDYIETSNRDRLEFTGTDFTGKKLKTYKAKGGNFYADYTIQFRQIDGKQSGFVDLLDTGFLHASIKAFMDAGKFQLKWDTKKSDGDVADNLDISKAIGFTDNDIEEIKNIIVNDVITDYRQYIGL